MVKLIWRTTTLPYTTLTWSGTDQQASREITFSLPFNPYDKDFKQYKIKKGDIVELREGKTSLFIGQITTREKKDEVGTSTYTARDFLHHLLNSTGTYIFKKTTPEAIAKKVCADVKVGTIDLLPTGITIPKMIFEDASLYDIIIKAYRKVKGYTGKNYMPTMKGKKVTIIQKGKACGAKLTQGVNITEATFTDTIDNMVDKVRIYNSKHKEIGSEKNENNIKKYGVYQQSYTKEKGVSASKAAKAMLVGVTREASISAIGDLRAISGYSITITDKATGLDGKFYITSDSHTFENGVHLMSLGLAWKDGMETGADVEKDENKKKNTTSTKPIPTPTPSPTPSPTPTPTKPVKDPAESAVEETYLYVKERYNNSKAYYIDAPSTGVSYALQKPMTYFHSTVACKKLLKEKTKYHVYTTQEDAVKNIKKMKRPIQGGKVARAHKSCPLCWVEGKYGILVAKRVY